MIAAGGLILAPLGTRAQDTSISTGIGSLQSVLDQIYTDMLPLCGQFIGIGQAIAGFAALFYIAYRVWRAIANAEAVDVFPLLRPFVLGFAISIFPSVIALINGVMSPTVSGSAQLLSNANAAIGTLLQEKENALKNGIPYMLYDGGDGKGSMTDWELYNGTYGADAFNMVANAVAFQASKAVYNIRNQFKLWLSEGLQIVYEAAALAINTLRTLWLIVLAILGPLVFGLSVFDGFHHTLTVWLARYINVFLWLPVANIFGTIIATIQTHMLQLDIAQLQANGSTYFSSTDIGYLVFLIIGIIGYFSVPSVSNFIVSAGGSGSLLSKTTAIGGMVSQQVVGGAGNVLGAPGNVAGGYTSAGGGRESWATRMGRAYGQEQARRNKISGKKS